MLKNIGIGAIIVAELVVIGLVLGPVLWDPKPINAERVASNRAALTQCHHNIRGCIGGYVHWDEGAISRLVVNNFGEGKIDFGEMWLFGRDDARYLNHIDSIVVPTDARWKKSAVDYERQFLSKEL